MFEAQQAQGNCGKKTPLCSFIHALQKLMEHVLGPGNIATATEGQTGRAPWAVCLLGLTGL